MFHFASSPVYPSLDMAHYLAFCGISGMSFNLLRVSLFALVIILSHLQQKTGYEVIYLSGGWRIWGRNQGPGDLIAFMRTSFCHIEKCHLPGFLLPSSLAQPVPDWLWLNLPAWLWLNLPAFLVLPQGKHPAAPRKKLCYIHNIASPLGLCRKVDSHPSLLPVYPKASPFL